MTAKEVGDDKGMLKEECAEYGKGMLKEERAEYGKEATKKIHPAY